MDGFAGEYWNNVSLLGPIGTVGDIREKWNMLFLAFDGEC